LASAGSSVEGSKKARSLWEWAAYFRARLDDGRACLGDLTRQTGKTRRYIQKALWILTWPEDIQVRVRGNPAVFPARVLLNHFAARMKHFGSQGLNGWRALRREVAGLESSAAASPRSARKGRGAKGTRSVAGAAASPGLSSASRHRTEALLRSHLQTYVTVDGENIQIRHHGEDDMERLLEIMGVPM